MPRDWPDSPLKLWAGQIGGDLATFLVWLNSTMLFVALMEMGESLEATATDLVWVMNAFTLVGGLLVAIGRVCDLFGRRRMFLIGTGLFAAGSLLGAVADTQVILIVSRAISGVGAIMILPSALAIVMVAPLRGRSQAMAFSVYGSFAWLGSALGPAVGGLLVNAFGWRSVFLVAVPICAISAALVAATVPETTDETQERGIDIAGACLMTLSMFAFTYALIEGPAHGWAHTDVVASLLVAALSAVAFVYVELTVENPLVEFRAFAIPDFLGGVTVNLLASVTIAGLLLFMSLELQELLGFSPGMTGILLLPLTASIVLLMPLGGVLGHRLGPRIPIVGGSLMVVVSFIWLAAVTGAPSVWEFLGPFLLMGLGTGILYPPAQQFAMTALPDDRAGTGSGLMTTSAMLGTSLGVALPTSFFAVVERGQLSQELANAAIPASETAKGSLELVLLGATGLDTGLSEFPEAFHQQVTDILADTFVYANSRTMVMLAAVTVIQAAIAFFVMRKSAPKAKDNCVENQRMNSEGGSIYADA